MNGIGRIRWATGVLVTGAAALAATAGAAPLAAQADEREYGIGIVAFPFQVELGREMPTADTLVVHAAPSPTSPVLARFLFRSSGPMGWSYALESGEESIRSNALEYGYEVEGLPLDSLGPAGAWARVIYGLAEAGPRHGWVHVEGDRARVELWADALQEQWLHFLRPDEAMSFHEAPGGARVAFEPSRAGTDGAFDYRMEPIEVRGRWMKVRVVTPNVPCSPAEGEPREATFWIEYLDERGRPRVWYRTRGC